MLEELILRYEILLKTNIVPYLQSKNETIKSIKTKLQELKTILNKKKKGLGI